jgi:hypothetical protein
MSTNPGGEKMWAINPLTLITHSNSKYEPMQI